MKRMIIGVAVMAIGGTICGLMLRPEAAGPPPISAPVSAAPHSTGVAVPSKYDQAPPLSAQDQAAMQARAAELAQAAANDAGAHVAASQVVGIRQPAMMAVDDGSDRQAVLDRLDAIRDDQRAAYSDFRSDLLVESLRSH